jgi:hypothetical protein
MGGEGPVPLARQLFDRAASQFRALEGPNAPWCELPPAGREPGTWNLELLRLTGLLPASVAGTRSGAQVDSEGVAHNEYGCAAATGRTRHEELGFGELVASACTRCGWHAHRPLGSLPLGPARQTLREADEVLSALVHRR